MQRPQRARSLSPAGAKEQRDGGSTRRGMHWRDEDSRQLVKPSPSGQHYCRTLCMLVTGIACMVAVASSSVVQQAFLSNRRQALGVRELDAAARSFKYAPGPLNVLYVVLEDFGVLGTSLFPSPGGAANGSTPHLGRLAARGVTFQHAYCQSPICNPSRSSLLVGRRPSHTRVYSNEDGYDARMPPSTPTVVDYLRGADAKASVACGGGKLFHEACDAMPRGFSMCGSLCGKAAEGRKQQQQQQHDAKDRKAAKSAEESRTNDEHKVDDTITLLAAYAKNRSRFFLGIGLSATHVMRPAGLCSHLATKAAGLSTRPDALASLPLPPRRSSERRPPLVTWPNYDLKAGTAMRLRKRGMSPAETRLAIGSYFACASHVDSQIGRMLDALDTYDLVERTAVVVHSDHGFSLGRHGRWSKYNLYEEATRIPLVIRVPGITSPAVVNDVVEAVDLLPTLLDLWGATRGDPLSDGSEEPTTSFRLDGRSVRLDGHSLVPFLDAAVQSPPPNAQSAAPSSAAPSSNEPSEASEATAAPTGVTTGVTTGDRHLALDTGGGGAPHRVISVGLQWSKWYARSELHETFRRNQFDGPVAGSRPADVVWPGEQLWVRTARYAYTAYLERLQPPNQTSLKGASGAGATTLASVDMSVGSYRLVDETLFDTGGEDPGESQNLAYDAAYQSQRLRLLKLCLRDWNVQLKGPRDLSRAQRTEYLKTTPTGKRT